MNKSAHVVRHRARAGPEWSAGPRAVPPRRGVRSFHQALARGRMLDGLYQVGINQLSRTIERRLPATLPGREEGGITVPRPVQARALAGALFALLRWWVDHDAPYTPEQTDAMYHAIGLTT